MLLSHLGYPLEEARLEGLVARAIAEGRCTRDVGGTMGTREVGDWIVEELGRELGLGS
jgi:3-isopropylmalate dehydrogenase